MEYTDVIIEVHKINKKEVENLKQFALGIDWGYRFSKYFGPTVFTLKRRFDSDKYADTVTTMILKWLRKRTKKPIRIHSSHQQYWDV